MLRYRASHVVQSKVSKHVRVQEPKQSFTSSEKATVQEKTYHKLNKAIKQGSEQETLISQHCQSGEIVSYKDLEIKSTKSLSQDKPRCERPHLVTFLEPFEVKNDTYT